MSTFEENWELGLVTAEAVFGIGFSGMVEELDEGEAAQRETDEDPFKEPFCEAAD